MCRARSKPHLYPQFAPQRGQEFRRQQRAVIDDVGARLERLRPGGGFHRVLFADEEVAVARKRSGIGGNGGVVGQIMRRGERCALRTQAVEEAFGAGDGGQRIERRCGEADKRSQRAAR